MLVASNEPPLLAALGPYSPLCDTYGVDFLWPALGGLVGVQRKACADLVASLRDHRISDMLTRSGELVVTVLLIEGDWRWDTRGYSRRCVGFTEDQLAGLKLSLQVKHGVVIVETRDLEHTAVRLPVLESWFQHAEQASSLLAAPKRRVGVNGREGTALRVWQCVPGVSLGVAKRLWDAVGLPLALTVDEKELGAVEKVGKKRVQAIRETFGG